MGDDAADDLERLAPADWLAIDVRSGPGRSLRAPLFRALGIKRGEPYRPTVLDATAGYGEDAWLAAAAGCRVIAVERNAAVFAALSAAHAAASAAEPDIASRIEPIHADAAAVLADAIGRFGDVIDAVYLDPMFTGKRRGAERKAMRLLRAIAGDDADADALLDPALRVARRRVVVKRSPHAPRLAGRVPDLEYDGRGFRFDAYLTGRASS